MVNLHRIPEGAMAEMPNQRDDGHQYAKNTFYSEASQVSNESRSKWS
jgi:hypothetical protein